MKIRARPKGLFCFAKIEENNEKSEGMKKMNIKTVSNITSAVIGALCSFFGVLAVPLALLVPCNIIDYFTGMRAAKLRGEKITSKISVNGIYKKVTMYILIFVGFGLDCMIGYILSTLHIEMPLQTLFAAMVASWLVINELISITENCEAAGVTIPILGPVLRFVKKKIEAAVEVDEVAKAQQEEE